MDYKYQMEVYRFRRNGKFYDAVSFGTNAEYVHNIVNEMKQSLEDADIGRDYIYQLTGYLWDSRDCHPDGRSWLVNL